MNREKLSQYFIDSSLTDIKYHTKTVLEEKGNGTFSSIHEILGVITEEYEEFKDAVHMNNLQGIRDELLDIATACQFAVACIDQESLDW